MFSRAFLNKMQLKLKIVKDFVVDLEHLYFTQYQPKRMKNMPFCDPNGDGDS